MAITITSQPVSLTPHIIGQPIAYEFTSNATDLQYCIIEVLFNGVRFSARSVQPDLGTTDTFYFDISEDAEKQLLFTPKTIGSNGVLNNDTNKGLFNIKIYEVTLVGGLIVTDYDPDDANNVDYDATTAQLFVFNCRVSHFDLNTFNITDYQLTADTKLFLTDTPYAKRIELGSDEFIGILYHQSAPSKNFRLEVLTYNSSDALLNTDVISIPEWELAYGVNPVNAYIDLCVGTQNLINEGISLTNVAYYTIQVINVDGDKSEKKRFNIVEACDTDTRIHFVNKYGKQDSYTFKGNKIETLSHKSTIYQKALKTSYNSSNRGFSVIENVGTRKFTVYTDSIGKDEYNFLSSILFNKMAFVEINNSYFPIIIEDESLLIRDEKNVPIQFTLVYSFANKEKGLRG